MKTLFTILAFAFFVNANAQFITTIAGNGTPAYSGDGGLSVSSVLHGPYKICFDAAGNIYFTDGANHCIRKIDVNGIITTVAGTGIQGYSGDGGPATSATLKYPNGVYVDAAGNIYITDTGNHRIRKVDVNGVITTIAGTGTQGYSGDGGPAALAKLSVPFNTILDGNGNMYISDGFNNCVRKVDASGIITTVAGTGMGGYSGDGGSATSAKLNNTGDITLDAAGNLFICDAGNYRLRKVDAAGTITTIAGNGTASYSGDGGPAVSAGMNGVIDVDLDGSGNIYITEQYNNCIRKIDANGIITTIAGAGIIGYSGDGGPAIAATFHWPSGIAFKNNNIYIADAFNNCIRMICSSVLSVSVSASNTVLCAGNSMVLNAGGANTYTYSWSTAEAGVSNISVSPSVASTYYVQGKDLNGCVGSASIALSVDACLGVDEVSTTSQLNIYPNPAASELNITGIRSVSTTGKITLVNSLGQVVRSIPLSEKPTIDVSDFKNGLYFISIENDSKIVTKLFNKIQ